MESHLLTAGAMTLVFIIGYIFITIEHYTKINKATIAIMMAILCWVIAFADGEISSEAHLHHFESGLADVFQVTFFLFGALAVVEIIDRHRWFELITRAIKVQSKKKMLWTISIITFFLSSILDNLTTTIVMVSLLKKILDESEERWLIGCAVVIAANAGGAWTPIGDVTTTMLWIGDRLSAMHIIKGLLFPSLICLLVSVFLFSFRLEGSFTPKAERQVKTSVEPKGELIFFLGLGLLIFVPIFKVLTGLPPFMGVLLALSILWIVTDCIHSSHEDRDHLRVPYILSKIDLSTVFFFMGILLCIGALYSEGLLTSLATTMDKYTSYTWMALSIGFASAVVDNVPLVAASMGMYSLEQFPMNHEFWSLVAYTAGTGGSMLIIGSAAGVALMGMEKINFLWYTKKAFIPATCGYLAGFLAYQALSLL